MQWEMRRRQCWTTERYQAVALWSCRNRREGYEEWAMLVSYRTLSGFQGMMYLDDGEAQHGCCDIADPHTSKHGNKHVGEQDSPWLCSSLTQNKGSHHLGNVVLGQSSGNGKATKEKHDDWSPHSRENVTCRVLRVQPLMSVIASYNVEGDC